jgi:hypothetical protein
MATIQRMLAALAIFRAVLRVQVGKDGVAPTQETTRPRCV